jgi:ferritin-like metal-binding protein YciE
VSPSKFTVVRHLMDRLASELAIGRDLRERIAGMPASHRREVLEQYLGETLGHAERVRERLLALGGTDERAGLGARLAAAVVGRTRALASASAGSGGNARILDGAMDDCAAVARELAAYVALARLARQAEDDATADLAAEHLADEERMLQRLLAEVSDLAETLVPDVPAPAPVAPQGRRSRRTSRGAPARYDGLPADQVIARLGDLSQTDLARLAEHERGHRNRAAVLDRIDALRGDEPWLGYDALNVASVRSALDGATREQLDVVHDYETVHKNRDTVLKAAAR